MKVTQWYTQTYWYKVYDSTDANGDAQFVQEAGADKVFSAKCRAEQARYTHTAWHQDQIQPNIKLSSLVKHTTRDQICIPDDDPTDLDSFQRVTNVRPVRNKAGRLVHYVTEV